MADTLPADTGSPSVAALAPVTPLDAWNAANPVGTWVIAYPGAPGDRPVITRTRASAGFSRNGRPVVWLEGYDGYLQLEHVTAITKKHAGQLLEQRHQFLDLDADSVCPFSGASLYPYPTTGGTP
ncbi:hypothetical protein ACFV1H_18595 [Streptomyces virginiae]|uniref:hypothetical protein n=1 Tax=Streptomyces virginiae TaxID=1961 RepID=UPI0036AE85F4